MDTIIAGRFDTQDQGESALQALEKAGFGEDALTLFYVSQDGQHDISPTGGDEDDSAGARDADKGAAVGVGVGAAVGAAAGVAAIAVTGPIGIAVGAGVGAYTGSLAGALKSTNKESDVDEVTDGEGSDKLANRKAGIHVAVRIETGADTALDTAVQILQQHKADDIEHASGRLEEGQWKDFDPRKVVKLV